ncbi:PQ loop repeat-domain-containing protein [Desarmillaria tabescens]|uniref:PQ loop repeat-domain-containing protein n=1 Tax=Armillaria tabescens TaxID=1929756 RepID=A0AA39NE37_ARMTA|nr:PQ loop repeat-domain-containing protein [Desarmillaria tabescens]KAK0463968.1 PQ loop repeat-domain-containing protein [Desarmillaria tabescens]
MLSPSQAALSEFLGYSSIACWLGAQFPQVLENIRSNSCEGLALPFLANWLMGDISNLVGCILTHQLPFQTYLATYFVFVDCTLVGQYIYYTIRNPPSHVRALDRPASRYRTLSVVAASVAKAACASRATRRPHRSPTKSVGALTRVSRESDDEVDDSTLAALADSFHSEGGRRTRISWSSERHGGRGGSVGRIPSRGALPTALHMSAPSAEVAEALIRGRSLQRDADADLNLSQDPEPRRRSSRRGASMVFFGVWALFSVGALAGSQRHLPLTSTTTRIGNVLAARGVRIPDPQTYSSLMASDVPTTFEPVHSTDVYVSISEPSYHQTLFQPSNERVLGRIFAWLCTTLYLTSRLPQIWKNYVRKSVQGLSMYLFVFAFLGNCFYVASIATSPMARLPPPASTDFIKESIPYLLGSGGTLLFDITIVMQSFIYAPKSRRRSSSVSIEEDRRLLDGDALAHARYNTNELRTSPERTLSRTLSATHARSLVLDYLSHQCYTRTARAFAEDSAVRHLDADGDEVMQPADCSSSLPELSEEVLKQADQRAEIRQLLLSGKVDEATDLLNKYFPAVLSMTESTKVEPPKPTSYVASTSVDPAHLLLNLRIQAWIESCRTIPLKYPPTETESPPPKSQKRSSQALHEDDPETRDQQTAQLKNAQKLYALASHLPSAADQEQYIEELKNVLGILAYIVPEDSSVAKYLSQERREAVADQINNAILYRTGLAAVSRVELIVRQTSSLWSFARDLNILSRSGTFLPPSAKASLKMSGNSDKGQEIVPLFDLSQFLDSKA